MMEEVSKTTEVEEEKKEDNSNKPWTPERYEKLKVAWNGRKTSEAEADRLNKLLGRTMGRYSWDARIKKGVGPDLYKSTIEENKKPKLKQVDLPNVEKIEVPDDRWNSLEARQQKKIEANPTRLAIDFNRIVDVSLIAGADRYVEKYIMLSEYTKILTENESLQRKLEKFEEMESFMEGYKKFLRKLGSVEEFSPKVVVE